MAYPQQPQQGARFQLTRMTLDQGQIVYQLQIKSAKGTSRYQASCPLPATDDATWSFSAEDGASPLSPTQERFAKMLLRVATQRAQRTGRWPRRVRRWHPDEA